MKTEQRLEIQSRPYQPGDAQKWAREFGVSGDTIYRTRAGGAGTRERTSHLPSKATRRAAQPKRKTG